MQRELTERLQETTCRSASVTIVVKELEKRYQVSPWAPGIIQRVAELNTDFRVIPSHLTVQIC